MCTSSSKVFHVRVIKDSLVLNECVYLSSNFSLRSCSSNFWLLNSIYHTFASSFSLAFSTKNTLPPHFDYLTVLYS